ncbi:hypothetical protein, partial [Mycobacteroides abscessus]
EVAQAVQKHNLDAYNALTCARQHLDGIDSIKSDSAADLPATGALTDVSVGRAVAVGYDRACGGIKLAMWGARPVIAALFDGAKERLAEPVVSFPMWSSVIQTVNGLIHLGIRWREKAQTTILQLDGIGKFMIDYSQFPQLDGVYLEDSFVLGISEIAGELSFKLEAVLTPQHPNYHEPLPGNQYCYADGELLFADATSIDWVRRSANSYIDAAGEEDLGNIDSLTDDGGTYTVEGDWGEVRICSTSEPRFISIA